MKIAVYTAITKGHDTLKDVPHVTGADFFCFTDGSVAARAPWCLVPLSSGADARRAAKDPKVRAHRYLPEHEYSLWIDGACGLFCSPKTLVDTFLTHADVAVFRSAERDCVYDEATFCLRRGLDDAAAIAAQIDRYWGDGIPRSDDLFEGGVILRRHTPRVATFEDAWWMEIVRGSVRDQISLPVALRTAGIGPAIFPGSIRQNDGFFSYTDHGIHLPKNRTKAWKA